MDLPSTVDFEIVIFQQILTETKVEQTKKYEFYYFLLNLQLFIFACVISAEANTIRIVPIT